MKVYRTDEIRNVVLLGHGGSGKTSLAEAMAYVSGATNRMGKITDGNTISDFDKEEQKREFSISTSLIPIEWEKAKINILDTPGYFDFVGEVEEAVSAADAAVIVVSGKAGVEVGTEKAWELCDKYKLPRMVYVNKMDITGADFYACVDQIKQRLGAHPVPIQLPIGAEDNFQGIVDLIKMRAFIHKDDLGREIEETDIPEDLKEAAEKYRSEMIEAAAEQDDELMMKYLEGEEFTEEEIKAAIRKATIACEMNPVFCGTAYRNKGVQPVIDAVIDYLPAPTDIPAIKGVLPDGTEAERHASDEEPFSALAFKIMTDPFVGKLAFFRVYSGTLESGSYVLNATKNKRERIGRILQMHANTRQEITEVYAGDIAAAVGLKDTTTGDTLCDPNNAIILESMEFPEPVIDVAIEPKSKAAQEKMGIALQKLAEEDPTFRVKTDEETGQTIISGMGELHLEIIVDRLLREFKVEANVGAPQVAYRETITKPVDVEYKYSKQSGGRGQYGHVKLRVTPQEPGAGYVFENKTVGGSVPKEYVGPTDMGIQGAMQAGVVAGYPVVDVAVELYDGSYHEVDSSEMAFKMAGSMAMKEALKKGDSVLLEPYFKVEVVTPEEYMGDVMGGINSKRGLIQGMEARAGAQVINAFVPLSEMFGYATDLRSKTQGRGTYAMEPSHYEEVPKSILDTIVASRAKKD